VAAKGAKARSASSTRVDVDDVAGLLPLALSTPAVALARARQVLSSDIDELSASYAHQAAGIVLRDRGELPGALRELRTAIRSAQRTGWAEREADVRATLGAALVMAGRTREGLGQLEAAADSAHGALLAKIRLRRAHVLYLIGRFDEAQLDLQRGLATVRRTGDTLWQARILNNRCLVHLAIGALGRAAADAGAAQDLFDNLGQGLESVQACHNQAIVATRRGDLPGALRLLDLAESRYRALGVSEPDVIIDRGQVLLAAGLATEALAAADEALAHQSLQPVKRAELLFLAAKAALAAAQLDKAAELAQKSRRSFQLQRRQGWQARASFLGYQARYLLEDRSERLLTSVLRLTPQLAAQRAEEAPLAYLLAGRLAEHRGQHGLATANFAAAADLRWHGSPLNRATGWLAVAMLAASQGRRRAVLSACGRGLDALDEHLLVFGAAELRALATFHGRDLAKLAIDASIGSRSPWSMLEWTERWRATALAEPSVRPHDDGQLEQELAALRDAARRLEEAGAQGASTGPAHQQRSYYEAAVSHRRLRLSGPAGSQSRLDLGALLGSLDGCRLVTLVEVDGMLHSLTVSGGRIRKHQIGSMATALRELRFARFALRRAAHARDIGDAGLGQRLQQALLGPVARLLDGGPVVIVPPATLHSAPWGLLPALAELPVSVSPSAVFWSRASAAATDPPADRRVALVLGPGLGTGGSEIAGLARLHRTATVMGRQAGADPASVEGVLACISGVWLAHIAAHGSFRADSPLFSCLTLDDGPLFVHDIDRLGWPPHRVVLSACDSGVGAPVGADELLGMVSGLLRLGSAGVLASVVPVNDEAAAAFMLTVHQSLLDGATLPEAALSGRRAATRDPLAAATAASFSVWGC